MRRREFMALGGAGILAARGARAAAAMPIIGLLGSVSPYRRAFTWAALRTGPRETGYAVGQQCAGRISLGRGQ